VIAEPPDLTVGTSERWRSSLRLFERFAQAGMPILLLGPTGSGKTTIAAQVHRLSGRRGPFVSSSIPAVPPELRHSILQGHVRGAFTGAVSDHPGLLEQAHRGTLFLDEIGLIPASMQELLLTVLDGQPITRVGDVRSRHVDTRLVFATNSRPQELVQSGVWRPDFSYRLGYFWVELPGLREREQDILPLAQSMMEHVPRGRGEPAPRFGSEVKALFLRHPWPGNLRELRSVIEYAMVMRAPGEPVQVEHLPAPFLEELAPVADREAREAELRLVKAAIGRHGGNKSAAARELGVSRQKIYDILDLGPLDNASGEHTQQV
jgi:transcriptional regulator with PAS, ATPase and Fis domain